MPSPDFDLDFNSNQACDTHLENNSRRLGVFVIAYIMTRDTHPPFQTAELIH
jgi:hypothetical protein